MYTLLFQSHNGLILILEQKSNVKMCFVISIPQWSDFNAQMILVNYNATKFQSHNGLILIFYLDNFNKTAKTFQSHNGLILILLFNNIIRYSFIISIPQWSDFNYNK